MIHDYVNGHWVKYAQGPLCKEGKKHTTLYTNEKPRNYQ